MATHKFFVCLAASIVCCGLLTGCGGSSGAKSANVTPDIIFGPDVFDDLYVYHATSAYGDAMLECVKYEEPEDSCSLDKLPLIGMDLENPTVDDIMSRVLVSHDWMGERFEQALYQLPADMQLLLRATTAIVIDDDIRPAYYSAITGAIYLDPAYLWLTSTELATINRQEDYRAGFSDPLSFRYLHRYLRNGSYVYPYGLLDDNVGKTIQDMTLLIGQLLYHELAHANDFLPPAIWDHLDPSKSILEAVITNEDASVAVQLDEWWALSSELHIALAEVMYHGRTASAYERSITADEAGEAFEFDVASDHYAYSSIYEDSAMLFEESMMKYHFELDREIAFTTAPSDDRYCNYYFVEWGVRNRIGDSDVKARAQFVVGKILPSAEMSMFFQELSAPQPMIPGNNWCLNAPLANGFQKTAPQALPPSDLLPPHPVKFR